MPVGRSDVLAFRTEVQGLAVPYPRDDLHILDIGVQDTGPDGAGWALQIRGAEPEDLDDLALIWSIRGAPHLYRRRDLPEAAAAGSPYSEADAAKRIFDAAKPLRAAGISALDALDQVAARMREIVTEPMTKGEVSGALTPLLGDPYLGYCRSCGTVHIHEMLFRLAAPRAGLELQAGTSPPVLRQGFPGPAHGFPARLDLIRGYLHFFGPATPRQVAAYLDAPVRDVQDRWPADAGEVMVDVGEKQEQRWILADDQERLLGAATPSTTRLLGPFDPYLQLRDRETLVPDPARRKGLWPALGRPGAVLSGGELVATWRPRMSGKKLVVRLHPWTDLPSRIRSSIDDEAERLAGFRGATSVEVADES